MEERRLPLSTEARSTESFRLDGKVAVVTGGASGIGRAIVQRFARSGACVRILDIDQKQAEVVALDVVNAGGNASAFQCDVTSHQNVKAVFKLVTTLRRMDNERPASRSIASNSLTRGMVRRESLSAPMKGLT